MLVLYILLVFIGNRNNKQKRGWIFMMVLCIILALVGLLMILKPAVMWAITESWKSNGATEPSNMYVWSIRFGGVMCTAVGVAGIFVLTL